MPTIPQQLIDVAERALKAGSKSGKECAAFTRKHAPDLAANHISHLFLAFKMVKRAAQFGPAIEAAKAGKPGTLAQLAKPYQGAGAATPRQAPKGSQADRKAPASAQPYGAGLDNELAEALGIKAPRRQREPEPAPARRRRNDPPPNINPKVFTDFAAMVERKSRKG